MSGELAVIEGGPSTVTPAKVGPVDLLVVARQAEAAKELGKTLIASGFLPDAIKKPEQAVLVIMKGQELSLPPIYSLSQIAVVSGKPTLSAELMATLVRRAGHTLRIIETSNEECTVEGIRADDKQHHQRVTFTLNDARQAGVGNNPTWKKYPRAMLRSRAVSELCRGMFSDALGGLSYTPEELGAEVDGDGVVVTPEAVDEAHRQPPVEHVREEPANEEVEEAEVVGEAGKAEHALVLTELQRIYYRIPDEKRPDEDAVFAFAEKGLAQAQKGLARIRSLAAEAGMLPEEPDEDAEIVREYVEESVPSGPHPEQEELIEELAEKLYGKESKVLPGLDWLEEKVLGHPISDLTNSKAKQLIDTMREELATQGPSLGQSSE